MRLRHSEQLFEILRQGHIEALLASPHSFKQELESEGRLAGTGTSLHQMQTVLRKPTLQNIVETNYAGR
jgi:hypothetical protein